MARVIAERADALPTLAEVFREYGYEGATLARISERTGLGRGSLYHFFPGGKAEMGDAVLAEIHGWFETHVFAALDGGGSAAAGLDAMFDAVADYFHSGRRVCIVGAFALTETRDRFAERVQVYFREWRRAVTRTLERGGVDAIAAGARAEDIVIRIQGALVLARSQSEPAVFMRALVRLRREVAATLDTSQGERP